MGKSEQNICIKCGLCCDGTLFDFAKIDKSEALETDYSFKINTNNRRAFKQPCSYLLEKVCNIYQERPYAICERYKCKLLKTFLAGDISYVDALKKIDKALSLKTKIELQIQEQHPENTGDSIRRKISDFNEHFEKTMNEVDFRKKYGKIILDSFILNKMLNESFKGKKAAKDQSMSE